MFLFKIEILWLLGITVKLYFSTNYVNFNFFYHNIFSLYCFLSIPLLLSFQQDKMEYDGNFFSYVKYPQVSLAYAEKG